MKHLITLIAPDGSIKTSNDYDLSIEERDTNENYSHNKLFVSDIYNSEWWSLYGMPLESGDTFTASLYKIVSFTDIIAILDISYVTKDSINHKAIQIVSPSISKVTDLQKTSLCSLEDSIQKDSLETSIIDCINDYESYDIVTFDTVDEYYEKLGINFSRKINK